MCFFDVIIGVVLGEVVIGVKFDVVIIELFIGLLLVMNVGDGMVFFIDFVKCFFVVFLMIGGSFEVVVVDGKGFVYVNVEDCNEIVVMDVWK